MRSGTDSFDFDAWFASGLAVRDRWEACRRSSGASDPSLTPGTALDAQYWSRDPLSSAGTGLTDAIEFTVTP